MEEKKRDRDRDIKKKKEQRRWGERERYRAVIEPTGT